MISTLRLFSELADYRIGTSTIRQERGVVDGQELENLGMIASYIRRELPGVDVQIVGLDGDPVVRRITVQTGDRATVHVDVDLDVLLRDWDRRALPAQLAAWDVADMIQGGDIRITDKGPEPQPRVTMENQCPYCMSLNVSRVGVVHRGIHSPMREGWHCLDCRRRFHRFSP